MAGAHDGRVTLSTKLDTSGIQSGAKGIKSALSTSCKAVAALGAATAAAIVTVTKKSVDAYAAYEQLAGGVETLFKQSADKVKAYAESAYKTAGVSANAYMETVTSFSASLISSLGGNTEKAADVANMAMVDMSDNANKMGTPLANIQNAYQGFAKQNYTMLDNLKLGYGGTKTEMERLLKDAEAFSGVKYDINNLSDVYQAIHQIQVKLGVAGTTAKEAESTITGSITMTKSAWENLLTAMSGGGSLDRAINDFVYSLEKAMQNILPVVERSLVGIGYAIERLAPKLVERIAVALIKAIPSLLNAIYKMVIGLAQGVYQGIKALFTGGTTEVLEEQAAQIEASVENQEALTEAVKETEKATKKALAGFDELNIVSQDSAKSAGESNLAVDKGLEIPSASTSGMAGVFGSLFDGVNQDIEEVYGNMQAVLTLVGLVGAGILAWRILDAYTAGVSLTGALKGVGAMVLIIAGAVLLIKGYCDGWVNGIDWKNLLITLGGIALILTGITIKFGTLGLGIGLVASGIALVVLGVVDFIKNGPTLQNTILIIGGAVAVAVGLATAGLSVLLSAIIAAIAAVAAFTAAILLEEPAIKSVEEAQEALTAAKERAAEAENSYINAVDAAESAMNRLKEAEESAGISGEELYRQVQSGTLDYADMTDAQKEVYKAYLDNEKKQKDLKTSTEQFNAAKKAETIASYENQLALAKESGDYNEFKQSVVEAFEAGKLSADEARELIGKSMSEMSDDAQKTFMEDLPGDIKKGLDPSQYETTRKKLGDWFKRVGEGFIENIWNPIKDFWNNHIAKFFTAKWWGDLAKNAINGFLKWIFGGLNSLIDKLNSFGFNLPDILGGGRIGFDIKKLEVPQLAKGAVLPANKPFLAMVGDQKHGTNIEAPLTTIQEAVRAELGATEAAIISAAEALIERQERILAAIGAIEVGDTTIGQAANRYNQKMAVIKGGL